MATLNRIRMFNRTYTRLVRKAVAEFIAEDCAGVQAALGVPVTGPLDESVMVEIAARCVSHMAAVEQARAKAKVALGIPMWATLERYDPAPVVAPPLPRVRPERKCAKCDGSGTWSQKTERTAETGEVVKAVCYACQGRGVQSDRDQRRNWAYHSFYYRLSA